MTNVGRRRGLQTAWGCLPCSTPPCICSYTASLIKLKRNKMKLNNRVHFQTWVVVQKKVWSWIFSAKDLHKFRARGRLTMPWAAPTLLSRSHVIVTIKPLTLVQHLIVYKALSHSSHLPCGRQGMCVLKRSGLLVGCLFIPFTPRILVVSDMQDSLIKVQQIIQVWALTGYY